MQKYMRGGLAGEHADMFVDPALMSVPSRLLFEAFDSC
jgi:hypothetical protein